jgi:hypothetical protein
MQADRAAPKAHPATQAGYPRRQRPGSDRLATFPGDPLGHHPRTVHSRWTTPQAQANALCTKHPKIPTPATQQQHKSATRRAATVRPRNPLAPTPASIGPPGRAVCAAPDLTPTTRGRDQERRRRQVKRIESPTRAGETTGEPFPTAPGIPLTFPPHPHSLPLRAPPKAPLRGAQPREVQAGNRLASKYDQHRPKPGHSHGAQQRKRTHIYIWRRTTIRISGPAISAPPGEQLPVRRHPVQFRCMHNTQQRRMGHALRARLSSSRSPVDDRISQRLHDHGPVLAGHTLQQRPQASPGLTVARPGQAHAGRPAGTSPPITGMSNRARSTSRTAARAPLISSSPPRPPP